MDLSLSADQKSIVDSVTSLLQKHAGPKRAIELNKTEGYDFPLHDALEQAGFFSVLRDAGSLEAVLVGEAIGRAAGVVSFGANAIVLAGLSERELVGPVALAVASAPAPLRFGAHAKHMLSIGEQEVTLAALGDADVAPVSSSFMYPFGRLTDARPLSAERLDATSAQRARDLWRLALAAEIVGTMDAALDLTVQYVSNRRQFGRAIGSFQAVKHRLALAKVMVEGARALTYEAAYRQGASEPSAAAASYATQAAKLVHGETHQLTGALGFTREHDLHVWSMRLQALRLELDGTTGHRRALAAARWGLTR